MCHAPFLPVVVYLTLEGRVLVLIVPQRIKFRDNWSEQRIDASRSQTREQAMLATPSDTGCIKLACLLAPRWVVKKRRRSRVSNQEESRKR
jgi:hypothetical protein